MQEKIVLDYGCGLGGNYGFLSRRGKYFGADILKKNISYASERYKNSNFILFSGWTLPFAEHFFDEIHAYDVLEHVEDLEAVLFELDRVLKTNGDLFITVPAEISEKKLLKFKPDYFKEVGHVRIVDPKALIGFFTAKNYRTLKIGKVRGMEALVLSLVFWLSGKKPVVAYQTGSPQFSKWLVGFIWLFDSRLFRTKLKYLFFIYWLTLFIGWLISSFFPKTIYLIMNKVRQ